MVLQKVLHAPFSPALREPAQGDCLPFGNTALPPRTAGNTCQCPRQTLPCPGKGGRHTHPQTALPHMVTNNLGALYPEYQPILHAPALALEPSPCVPALEGPTLRCQEPEQGRP